MSFIKLHAKTESPVHVQPLHNKGTSQATGDHLNFLGHSLSDMKVMVIEKVKVNDVSYKKERESYHIRKFNTYYRGITRKP